MSPELIKYSKKVDSLREVLKQHGFEKIEFFWYSDGFYHSSWSNMSVAEERPDRTESLTTWQFGFRSCNENDSRLKLEALYSLDHDEHNGFVFDLKYYPSVRLHQRVGYYGPTAYLIVSCILEEDLTNLQKYIEYLTKK